ncbi:MAG: putative lipid II flippase FtsW [Candidatus Komeilibacteria bacterium]|nr:putative lipid II flippase FtsW [Candidatus Komeilibacteria bacterium]
MNRGQKQNFLRRWWQHFQGNDQHHQPDYWLLTYVIILLVFGLLMLASASSVQSFERFGDSYYILKNQIVKGIIPGLLLAWWLSIISYQRLKKFVPVFFFAIVALLLAVLVTHYAFHWGGASRWLVLGPIVFQPSEFMKLALVLYLAAWLEKRLPDQLKNWQQGLLPFMLIMGAVALLIILQPDMGTLLVILVSGFLMYFLAGLPWKHLAAIAAILIVGLGTLVVAEPYRFARLTTFLNPEQDKQGAGYHIQQAKIAVGSGGLFGVGIGKSRQKFNYLPQVYGDSIFAIVGEELGFIASTLLVLLYLLLGFRGFYIAKRAPEAFGKLVAIGITSWFTFQAFINIGAMIGIMPLTGIPLPFVSHGSSSLVSCLLAVGILLNISRYISHKTR